jgi:hypothetical protein
LTQKWRIQIETRNYAQRETRVRSENGLGFWRKNQ